MLHESLTFAKTIFFVLIIISCGGAPEQIVRSALSSASIISVTKENKWKDTGFATCITTTSGTRLPWTETISFILIKISIRGAPHISVITSISCTFIILFSQKLKKVKIEQGIHELKLGLRGLNDLVQGSLGSIKNDFSYRKRKMTFFTISIASISIQFRIAAKTLKLNLIVSVRKSRYGLMGAFGRILNKSYPFSFPSICQRAPFII